MMDKTALETALRDVEAEIARAVAELRPGDQRIRKLRSREVTLRLMLARAA